MISIARKLSAPIVAMLLAAVSLAACANDSETVSHNLSQDADNFKVHRRVVFFNGITDKYLLSIERYCSITDEGNQLEVTCKVGESTYKKHFLGLSDNVSYFVEQLEPIESDPYHYKVVFKPETIVPDVEPHTSDG